MRTLCALAAAFALGCSNPAATPPVTTSQDAGADVRDVPNAVDAPEPQACDAGPAGPARGMFCPGDAATTGSPGVEVPGGRCVNVGSLFNCGACGVQCEGGRVCCDEPRGSGRGLHCCFPGS